MNRRFEMARHAYTTVPFYRELAEKEPQILMWIESGQWEKLPLVEKNQIVLQQDKFISDDYLGELVMGRLNRTHTSGSTGTYLDVYWSKTDMSAALLPLWMERFRQAGVRTNDKVCLFNTTLQEDYQINGNKMLISKQKLNREKLIRIYQKMEEFNPSWLLVHPGIAQMILQMVKEEQLPILPNVKYIELTGEMVPAGLKQSLEKVFSCQVRSHYGTMEVGTIGYEYQETYQLFNQSTYVEIIDKNGQLVNDGEYGEVYVTSLHNHAMPFVRYGIGDVGRIVMRDITKTRLELKHARKNDLLMMPDGSSKLPDVLLGPVEQINQCMERMIYQFQVFQQTTDSLLINVVLDNDMEGGEFEKLYQKLFEEEWKEEFKWKFQYSNEVQVNQETGKSGWFFSRV